jgi:hypothetical protein
MSEEAKEKAGEETGQKLDKLIERAEELLAALKLVSEDLKQLSDSLKPYVQQVAPSAAAPQAAQPAPSAAQPAAQALTVESVQQSFPEDLQNLLNFQEQDEFIVIKPKGFLGSENFARTAEIIKKLGGDYISAGKGSHFRVSKQR